MTFKLFTYPDSCFIICICISSSIVQCFEHFYVIALYKLKIIITKGKVEALLDAPASTNVFEWQALLRFVQYYGRFYRNSFPDECFVEKECCMDMDK